MAFKIINDTVIHNDKLADISNVTVDNLPVLVGDGDPTTPVLLQNVDIPSVTADIATSLLDAQLYTDTQINTATIALEAYADQAEADAISAAQSYADSVVASGTGALTTDDIAEATNLYYTDDRVSTYLTVNGWATQAYADQAEADAVSTANTYTDNEITTATTALETYADQAEADANAYTDAREIAITTAYQNYTDTSVAGIVDSAPAVLDTLNELAAALGDDPSFATTVSNDIGTKVSKSGDTMTGALTLSGAPTSANHATTKAYVDSAVSTGTGALDTDSVPEGSSNLYYTDARVQNVINSNFDQTVNTTSTVTFDKIRITSTTDASATSTGHGLQIGSTSGQNLIMDTNEVFARNNGAVDGLHLNADGGDVTINNNLTDKVTFSGGEITATGDITAYSDRALKRNIQTLENGLDKVMNMRGVTFLKDGKASLGVIAQEVETVIPEVVKQDQHGMRSVAYGNIVGVLIEAIKEQQAQIEELKSKLNEK